MMEKLVEHTHGNHIYMKLKLNGQVYEVDVYIRVDKDESVVTTYKTTADGTEMRDKVIEAFNELY